MLRTREVKISEKDFENEKDWRVFNKNKLIADTTYINGERFIKLIEEPKDIFSYPVRGFKYSNPTEPVSYKYFYEKFLRSRVGESTEEDLLVFLVDLGYHCEYYSPLEIVKMTNAKMMCDNYWVDFGYGEIFFGLEDFPKHSPEYYLKKRWRG